MDGAAPSYVPAAPTPTPIVPVTSTVQLTPTVQLGPTVQLTFRDGSAVALASDDPRARAFRMLAGELVRSR